MRVSARFSSHKLYNFEVGSPNTGEVPRLKYLYPVIPDLIRDLLRHTERVLQPLEVVMKKNIDITDLPCFRALIKTA
jgi:hypothetical protein